MLRFRAFLLALGALGLGMTQFVVGQSFAGTFVSAEAGLSLAVNQGQDGSLSGSLTGPNGQFQLQGSANGNMAYGALDSQQGPLGFQAQLSADAQQLQIVFYQADANGQPVPAGPPLTLQRQGGVMGPGQVSGQLPGQLPGQFPGGASADWSGTFVGEGGSPLLSVQAGQGAYGGVLQFQGQQYQFQAHLDNQTLHGGFMANGGQYEFWADRNGANVILYLGDYTYMLQRQ